MKMKNLATTYFFISFGCLYCVGINQFSVEVIEKIVTHFEKGLNFMDKFYYHINLDGALGLTLAQSELLKIRPTDPFLYYKLNELVWNFELISNKIISRLPKSSRKNVLFINVLLKPNFWNANIQFERNLLPNLGLYNWSTEYILSDKEAVYNGIHSDTCMQELIESSINKTCKISKMCNEMMFQKRLDRGYLLTHRLLYFQIGIRSGCFDRNKRIKKLITIYCSYMFKEAKTNEYLRFPQHDIFLEQLVLCGIEGVADFLNIRWLEKIISWQTLEGCYTNGTQTKNIVRSTNFIDFGCTDHTTGLGIAALALYLHYTEINDPDLKNTTE